MLWRYILPAATIAAILPAAMIAVAQTPPGTTPFETPQPAAPPPPLSPGERPGGPGYTTDQGETQPAPKHRRSRHHRIRHHHPPKPLDTTQQ